MSFAGLLGGGGTSGGISIGDSVGGATNETVLYVDTSGNLAGDLDLTFNPAGQSFSVGADTNGIISYFGGGLIQADGVDIIFYSGIDLGKFTINPANSSGVTFEIADNVASQYLMWASTANRTITFGAAFDVGGTCGFVAIDAGDDTIRIRQLTGQTGRLTSWQAVGTNQLIGINVNGEMEFGPTSSGVKVSGFSAGYISFKGYGNTNNEELQFDFESIANTVSVVTTTGVTTFAFNSIDVTVPDEAYGAGWNGSLEVPTKNALYDKIETLGGSGLSHPEVMARVSIGI